MTPNGPSTATVQFIQKERLRAEAWVAGLRARPWPED